MCRNYASACTVINHGPHTDLSCSLSTAAFSALNPYIIWYHEHKILTYHSEA